MKKVVNTEKAPAAIGPYSQAIKANGLIFVSGQLPVNPADGSIPADVEAQAKQSLENVAAILASEGLTTDDVVKTTVFIKNMNDFAAINGVYAQYFTKDFPARACVEVARLPKDVLVEVEAIALCK
ncbi:RidA family protein [Sporomusa sphaeroides]|jgi:2-iminobutanoate/2-iminopropanoate deaminase|uniref:RutC family protein n=2 Tax=Sporomusa TaxID=2375 RepID=A0ABM9W7L1_9FIRM|nr:RidA family protein [Sporomusa sphaeroides]MCM0757593.1 RidA family protein [Sporomusa sphaeroides DSM 2875]OLS55298.1 RutC family protein [Sporomusa sphaeroides DSM 2875]CVK20303.1 RutC family protein [Sporomusa sphaeroides DSM 2875]SCM83412.1 ketoacid-binding protein [uncultured Sporomusa sp.]HML33061.1 RidA family protein [Sporomusa sphaeroides]